MGEVWQEMTPVGSAMPSPRYSFVSGVVGDYWIITHGETHTHTHTFYIFIMYVISVIGCHVLHGTGPVAADLPYHVSYLAFFIV